MVSKFSELLKVMQDNATFYCGKALQGFEEWLNTCNALSQETASLKVVRALLSDKKIF